MKKKPDIFLGITMGMLVLAAVLCLTILIVQKSNPNKTPTPNNPGSNETGEQMNSRDPNDTGSPDDTSNPVESGVHHTDPTEPIPADLAEIDAAGLKAALDDCLSGLPNDWQVVVLDPVKGTKVESILNSPNSDDWMKGDGMVPVFVMGTVFQQLADGTLTEDQVMEDLEAMIVKSDGAAADRLTTLAGGMDAVKKFASDNGMKLGYNRTMAGVGAKPNYVTALQMATILDKICKGELVSKDASAQMLELLCTAKESELIDPGVKTEGAKYGFVSYAKDTVSVATMGVVRLPHRSYVISVICNGPNNLERAKNKVTELLTLTEPYFAD